MPFNHLLVIGEQCLKNNHDDNQMAAQSSIWLISCRNDCKGGPKTGPFRSLHSKVVIGQQCSYEKCLMWIYQL